MTATRCRRAWRIVATAWTVFVLLTRTAHADELKARAARLFHEASDAYARGEFAAAASSFEESDRWVPRGAAIYDAAVAWEAAGDAARAAQDYESSVDRPDMSADQVTAARRQLQVLAVRVGALEVFAPAGAHIAVGAREGAGPRLRLYLEPGAHEIVVTSPGAAPERRTVDIAAGQSQSAHFEAPTPPPETRAAVPASHSSARRTWGWITLGSGVAFAGAAVYFGVRTLDERSALISSGDTSTRDHDAAVRDRLWTNVFWAAAGVAGVIGTTLLVWPSGSSKTAARVSVQIDFARASLVARGSF
jgi:hypothetical protein